MDIKTRIAKFSDFLGQQFYPIHGIAENNGLVDLKLAKKKKKKNQDVTSNGYKRKYHASVVQLRPNLGEKSVQAVNFLPFFNKSIKLSNTL